MLLIAAFQSDICIAEEVQQTGPRSAEQLEQFVSAYWRTHAGASSTPGLAIAFVQNGQVLFVKGYGVSNVESKKPFDASTLFRIASISKVFVGIAAAQAVERGQIAPDVDINSYLADFKVPESGFGSITLRNLLTHSSGIDDWYLGDSTRYRKNREELGRHLARHLPPRVRPPGKYMSYTNYGYALAAHVVESATNGGFAETVRKDILAPLGMHRSGYDFGDGVFGELATGYVSNDGSLKPQPYTWVHRYPSTSMVTSAADMARFVMAMTNGGCIGEACILSPVGRKYVFEQQFTHHKRMPGRTFGFAEWTRHNTRGIWHDGAHGGFSAQLVLLPELGSGFFIAVNGQNGGLDDDLMRALLDRFFARPKIEKLPEIATDDIEQIAGNYVQMRNQRSNLEKILMLRERPTEVTVSGNRIHFGDDSYYPIGDNAFQSEDARRIIAIERKSDGLVDRVFVDWGGEPRVLERVTPATDRRRAATLFGTGFLLLVLGALGGLIVRTAKGGSASFFQSFVRWLPIMNVCFSLILALGLLLYFQTADQLEYRMGEIGTLPALLAIPFAVAIITIACLLSAMIAIVGRLPSLKSEVLTLVVSCAGGTVLLFVLNEWSMIGWYF
jgi:CubicO group peptidase (beta-lactamase class C family)